MPCNMLAVQQGVIDNRYAEAILANLANPAVVTAVSQLMAEVLGVLPDSITHYPDGWLSRGQGNVEWVAERVCLRITAKGGIEYRDGKNLRNPLGQVAGATFKGAIEPLLAQLGLVLTAEVMKQTLEEVTYGVTNDYMMTNGSRVIEFDF